MRFTGLVPDIHDPNDFVIDDLYGLDQGAPDSFSNEDLLYPSIRQYRTRTCVACTYAQLVWAEQRRQGRSEADCKLISPGAAYYMGLRRQHGRDAALSDLGSRPRDVLSAMREVGAVSFKSWPYPDALTPSKVLDEPQEESFWVGSDKDWLGYFKILSPGEDRIDGIKRMVSNRKLVGIGLTLDKPFESLGSGVWPGRTMDITGRHLVAIYGYTPDYVEFDNWWDYWGNEGRGKMSWEAVCSLETTDISVVELDLTKW